MPFGLHRRPNPLVFRPARLASRAELAPGYVRLRLAGEALRGFDSPGPDDHIRVFFPPRSAGPDPFADGDDDAWRTWPSREYTPLAWDAREGTLDLEFFLHGGHGVASGWAGDAAIGAPVAVGGPRGSVVFEGRPDALLLAGDETAVPAMRRLVAHAGPDAQGVVLIEVTDRASRIPFDAPPGVEVRYVERDGAVSGVRLAAALGRIGRDERPGGAGYGFVAAEQSIVKAAGRSCTSAGHWIPRSPSSRATGRTGPASTTRRTECSSGHPVPSTPGALHSRCPATRSRRVAEIEPSTGRSRRDGSISTR